MAAWSSVADVVRASFRSLLGSALRQSWRRLARDRAFLVFAVVSLGIGSGLGSLAGAWSLGLLLRPLPYHTPTPLFAVRLESSVVPKLTMQMQASLNLAHAYAERHADTVVRVKRQKFNLAWHPGAVGGARVAMVDQVSTNYAELLGLRLLVGYWPRASSDGVLVSRDLAKRHFGNVRAALGQAIYLDGGIFRITGVLNADYLAPVPLAVQRAADARTLVVMPHDFAREAAAFAQHDQGGELTLVQEGVSAASVRAELAATMRDSNRQSTSLLKFHAHVEPLETMMLAGEGHTALLLWIASLVLLATALAGLAMFMAARYAARTADWFVQRMLGAHGWRAAVVEYAEIGWLLLYLLVAALVVMLAGVWVLAYDQRLQGVAGWPLTIRALALLAAELVLTLTVLLLVHRAQLKRSVRMAEAGGRLNRRTGALSRVDVITFRALLSAQVCIGLLASMLAGVSLHAAWHAYGAASGQHYAGLTAIHFIMDSKTSSGAIESGLMRVRGALAAEPGISGTALTTASPLDLEGAGFSIIMRSRGHETSYELSVVGADPSFFRLLGFPLRFGRLYAANERDVALATPAAQKAMVDSLDPAQLQMVAAPPQEYSGIWNDQIRIVGGVEARRVDQVGTPTNPFLGAPVVFEPFSAALADKGVFKDAWLIVRGPLPDNLHLASIIARRSPPLLHWQQFDLAEQVRLRLREHLLSSLAAVLLALVVVLSVMLGAFGAMHFSCQRRRQDYGVRLALGAAEGALLVQFVRLELILPLLLVLTWTGVAGGWLWFHGGVDVGPFRLHWAYVLFSGCIVMATVMIGFLVAMRHFRRMPPMEALRTE